jgi:hypothetical protein
MKRITATEMQGLLKQDFQDWLQEIEDEKNFRKKKEND